MGKLFTCEEVAARYSVTVNTVWDWIRTKKLNALKIGKRYQIREEDIIAFEKSSLISN
ncbi:MAG: helix-turn-helix domain-containing protein [Clostridiales bacterium]|nr:helix-turn-helix domain-containing protein [Clostridiales bacterium]